MIHTVFATHDLLPSLSAEPMSETQKIGRVTSASFQFAPVDNGTSASTVTLYPQITTHPCGRNNKTAKPSVLPRQPVAHHPHIPRDSKAHTSPTMSPASFTAYRDPCTSHERQIAHRHSAHERAIAARRSALVKLRRTHVHKKARAAAEARRVRVVAGVDGVAAGGDATERVGSLDMLRAMKAEERNTYEDTDVSSQPPLPRRRLTTPPRSS